MNIINDLPKKKKNINAEIFIQNQTRVVNIAVNLDLVRPNLLNNFSLAIGRTESPSWKYSVGILDHFGRNSRFWLVCPKFWNSTETFSPRFWIVLFPSSKRKKREKKEKKRVEDGEREYLLAKKEKRKKIKNERKKGGGEHIPFSLHASHLSASPTVASLGLPHCCMPFSIYS